MNDIYIPKFGIALADDPVEPMMLGLQGGPGIGKTWSILKTFPNVTILNFDNKHGAHTDRKDIINIKFYDDQIALTMGKELGLSGDALSAKGIVNRANICLKFLMVEGPKFTAEQTLFDDSWTLMMDSFDTITNATPNTSKKTGEVVAYDLWKRKIEFSKAFLGQMRSLKCKKVVAFHEKPERNDEGNLTGAFSIMDGAMKDQLTCYFTDWFRQIAVWENDKEGKKVLNRYWQIVGDNNIKCFTANKRLSASGESRIPATYLSLI